MQRGWTISHRTSDRNRRGSGPQRALSFEQYHSHHLSRLISDTFQIRGTTGISSQTPRRCQAARTVLSSLPTSSFNLLLSPDSDFAEDRTCVEAGPVSLAPCCTSVAGAAAASSVLPVDGRDVNALVECTIPPGSESHSFEFRDNHRWPGRLVFLKEGESCVHQRDAVFSASA
jgi:hypothetical protein